MDRFNIPIYPHDFTCERGNGAVGRVDNREVNKWINDAIHYLEFHPKASYAQEECGDTLVTVFKGKIDKKGKNTYYVCVSRSVFSIWTGQIE